MVPIDANNAPVMTVDEVAAYLRIPRASVYKLAQQGWDPLPEGGAALEVPEGGDRPVAGQRSRLSSG